MGKKYNVTMVAGEQLETEVLVKDRLLAEKTLRSNGLPVNGEMPMHYTIALIWASMVRQNLTAAKFNDFADLVDDFDPVKEDADDQAPSDEDPTQSAAATGEPYS